MDKETVQKIRMEHYANSSVRQIAEKLNLSERDVEDVLINEGFKPFYTVKQAKADAKKNGVKMPEKQKRPQPEQLVGAKKEGIGKGYKIPESLKAQAVELYKSGAPVSKIVEQLGISQQSVRRFLRAAGVYKPEKVRTAEQPEEVPAQVEQTENAPTAQAQGGIFAGMVILPLARYEELLAVEMMYKERTKNNG